MNKIIIFGDSFGDPKFKKWALQTAWYDMFKGYEITNHCLTGAGPHYSMKKYYDFIRNEPHKDEYIIIFLLSEEDRIAWPDTDVRLSTFLKWDFVVDQSWFADHNVDYKNNEFKNEVYNQLEYYHEHRLEIDYLFKTMRDEMLWINYKNLAMLLMNSFLFNIKTITCFVVNRLKFRCGHTLKELELLFESRLALNDNFLLYPYSLVSISEGEPKSMKEPDKRRNHLSQHNHEILYNNLNAFLNGSNNFLEHITNDKLGDNSAEKFIYE